MIPTGWALLIEPWRKIEFLAVAFLTFMAASVVTVWAFGPGLLQVVLDTPRLAQLAAAIGIPPAPISSVLPLTVSPLDPVLPFGDIPAYFNRYFFRPYSAVSTVTLAMIALRIFLPGARAASDTQSQLTLSWAISGLLQFCIISCRYPTASTASSRIRITTSRSGHWQRPG